MQYQMPRDMQQCQTGGQVQWICPPEGKANLQQNYGHNSHEASKNHNYSLADPHDLGA